MSKTTKYGNLAPYEQPWPVGDRTAPTDVSTPRQGELAFPAPGDDPPLMPASVSTVILTCRTSAGAFYMMAGIPVLVTSQPRTNTQRCANGDRD